MRRLSKIVSIVTTVFTVAVILCAGVFCLPRIFGYVPYVVLSGSMEPVIGTGAVAFINTNDRAVSEGDIIAYSLEDTVVIHRVICFLHWNSIPYSLVQSGYLRGSCLWLEWSSCLTL